MTLSLSGLVMACAFTLWLLAMLTRPRDALDERAWTRRVRAINAAKIAAAAEAAE